MGSVRLLQQLQRWPELGGASDHGLEGGRFALISNDGGSHLRRGSLDKPWASENPIKVTSHRASMGGSQLAITPGGDVVALAGKGTAWLLRAKLADLMKGPTKEK